MVNSPTPSFKGYLFWYVIVQCIAGVVVFAALLGYTFVMLRFGFSSLATIEKEMDEIGPSLLYASIGLSFGAAYAVASHYGIRFGKGFLGYFAGNIIATLIVLPLTAGSAVIVEEVPHPWALFSVMALIVAYAAGLAAAIRYGRRNARRRREALSLIEPFT